MIDQLQAIKKSSARLRSSTAEERNAVLRAIAKKLADEQSAILTANREDVASLKSDANSAFRDRLTLNEERLKQMAESLLQVADLPDPLNEVAEEKWLENGLYLRKVRSALGVILMVFEARPNVITEAFSLALKSGNGIILRGGSESKRTAEVLYQILSDALYIVGLPREVLWGITDPNRELVQGLMKQNQYIDVLVPRGGEGLIEYVVQNATIPIIKNDRGLCHAYLHEDADETMALDIVENGKVQRPGVCNSLETVLVHEKCAGILPKLHARLHKAGVQWFGCARTLKLLSGLPNVQPAGDKSFDTEYLDFKINARIVDSLDQAMDHIARHGSRHSETIVTNSEAAARAFQAHVDAAATYWNASTRFTDGFQFGLGGELGISTQKLHVRGPVGLRELTSLRWVIDGTGQIRR